MSKGLINDQHPPTHPPTYPERLSHTSNEVSQAPPCLIGSPHWGEQGQHSNYQWTISSSLSPEIHSRGYFTGFLQCTFWGQTVLSYMKYNCTWRTWKGRYQVIFWKRAPTTKGELKKLVAIHFYPNHLRSNTPINYSFTKLVVITILSKPDHYFGLSIVIGSKFPFGFLE